MTALSFLSSIILLPSIRFQTEILSIDMKKLWADKLAEVQLIVHTGGDMKARGGGEGVVWIAAWGKCLEKTFPQI